jgi:hypothetical protein
MICQPQMLELPKFPKRFTGNNILYTEGIEKYTILKRLSISQIRSFDDIFDKYRLGTYNVFIM